MDDALLAAACLALDPVGLGGALLRTARDERCEQWLAQLRAWLQPQRPWRVVPLHIDDERLLGGIDLAGTLRGAGPVRTRGLLEEAREGVLLLGQAERVSARLAGMLAQALEGEFRADAMGSERLALIALDAGQEEPSTIPAVLAERLGLHIDLTASSAPIDVGPASTPGAADMQAARDLLPLVVVPEDALRAVCEATLAFDIPSIRAANFALETARRLAALAGRSSVAAEDLQVAARWVLAPRARVLPEAPTESQAEAEPESAPEASHESPPEPAPESAPESQSPEDDLAPSSESLQERVLAATRAAIPERLLASLSEGRAPGRAMQGGGRAGSAPAAARRGRPAGIRAGRPGRAGPLNVVATLRAAAPWQRLRAPGKARAGKRLQVRADDFRVTRLRQPSQTATIFALDASGSSAMHRLAEAKGAIEMLLADCYVRRDQVAVIVFRGRRAEVALPPTRSLVRARRQLAGLPGGGGTPLASGIAAASELCEQLRRRGLDATVVLLTDGQANVGRDGTGGRAQAHADALIAARRLAGAQVRALLIDTSLRPQPLAQELAAAMRARYVPLPSADARRLLAAVKSA